MGFRFQRRISLIPGLRLNLSKSGVSMSVGGGGLTTNLSSSGLRTTIGIPGTGLSYRTSPLGSGGRKRKAEKQQPSKAPQTKPPPAISQTAKKKPETTAPELKKPDGPKVDWGQRANNAAAIINAISAVIFLFSNLVDLLSKIFGTKPEAKSLPEGTVIDVEAETQPAGAGWDTPPPIQPDPARYTQTDDECARLGKEQPENWEWLLVLQLMKLRFEELKKDWEDTTWARRPIRKTMGQRQAHLWCDFMLNQIQEIGARLKNAYGDEKLITKAFGPNGQSGNPYEIIAWMNGVCGELAACVDWEMEVQTLRQYPDGLELLPAMTGWTSALLNPFYELCAQMHYKLQEAGKSHELDMSLKLEAPPLDKFNQLLPLLKTEPWEPVQQT